MCYKATDPTSDMTLGKITSVEKCKVKKQRPHDTRSRTKIEETQMEPTRNRLIPPVCNVKIGLLQKHGAGKQQNERIPKIEKKIGTTTRANQSANLRCHYRATTVANITCVLPPLSLPPSFYHCHHNLCHTSPSSLQDNTHRKDSRKRKLETGSERSKENPRGRTARDLIDNLKSGRFFFGKLPPKTKKTLPPPSSIITRSQARARNQEIEAEATPTSIREPRSSTPIPNHRSPKPQDVFPNLSEFTEQLSRKLEAEEEYQEHEEEEEEDTLIAPQFYTPDMSLENAGSAGPPTTEEVAIRNEPPAWKRKGELTKMLNPRIKKFGEGKSSDLFKWLKDFTKLIYRLGIPRETGTELLPFFLTGTALEKYNTLDERTVKDWERMTKQLMLAHDCPTDREISLQELTSAQQGKKKVTEFAAHIRELGEYVYQSLPERNRDLLLASHFLTGCNRKIKARLRQLQSTPKTLRAMTAEAEKIQRLLELEEAEEETDAVIAAVQQMNMGQQNWGNRNGGRWFQSGGEFQGNSPRGGYRGGFNQNEDQSRRSRPPRGGYRGRDRGSWNQRSFNERNGNQENWSNGNWDQENGNHENGQELSNQAPQNTQENRRIGWDTTTGRPFIINSISKACLGIMMCLFLIGNTEATKQICGFGEAGNIFIPPTAAPCNFDRSLPLQTYAVNVYRQRIKAIQMEAHKCFKHEVEGEVYSFLKIYKTTEAKIGKRVPISVEECRKTAITKKFNDMELKEIAPGIYRSEKISEAAENATRILGTTTFKTFEFTMEVGQVASLEGIHALSTLGSLEKCTFGSGSCQDDSSTIVWQPQETRRECQFELIQSSTAIISQQFIAIEEMAIFSKFDTDLRRLQEALEGCFIHQGYRTDDGYLIEFPEVQSKGWVPDMHIDAQTFGGYHNPWFRRTRETVTSLGPAGTEFRAYIGEPFITPLIRRLYGTANIEELTDLKSPITDPEILQEFGKYNVTNKLLADRARFYPKDRKHLNPMLIIALKAIRVAQYGARQKKAMEQLKRPLTRGEEQLKLEIERKVAVTFDKLLEKEFGRSDPD
ncbi:hypothetical protein CRE_23192, partial [Caenorhabditis remanei]